VGVSEEKVPICEAVKVCPVVGWLDCVAVGFTEKFGVNPENAHDAASLTAPLKERKSELSTTASVFPAVWLDP
jgi:hypothetical protein